MRSFILLILLSCALSSNLYGMHSQSQLSGDTDNREQKTFNCTIYASTADPDIFEEASGTFIEETSQILLLDVQHFRASIFWMSRTSELGMVVYDKHTTNEHPTENEIEQFTKLAQSNVSSTSSVRLYYKENSSNRGFHGSVACRRATL